MRASGSATKKNAGSLRSGRKIHITKGESELAAILAMKLEERKCP